jgi:sugar-specific transcriptional regulator TrmB
MYVVNHTTACFRNYGWGLTESSTLIEKLRTLGLTENECKVYFALLKLGAGTIVQLSREARLQRTEVYPLMTRLVSKGLVEETIDRPRRYVPVDVKVALPRLAWKIRDRLDKIAKESEKLATKLQGFSMKNGQGVQEEIRVIYGPHASRAHLLESARSAKGEFWGMAGRRRPPHVSDRVLAEALRLITSNKVKSRFLLEVDRENLKRVKKIAHIAEVRHFEPIPVYMYGSDMGVAVSLVEEPIIRASQAAQLVSTYRPTVQVMRQLFNILWTESSPFAAREAILHGQRPAGEESRIMRGREEIYIHFRTMADSAKHKIIVYIPSLYGPSRLLKGLGEAFLHAHERGVKTRLICRLSDANANAVKALAKFAEVRHTENPIGFSMGTADSTDAVIYYLGHDSLDLESRVDYAIRIISEDGIRHLGNLFEALWTEATPMEDAMRKLEAPKGAAFNSPA